MSKKIIYKFSDQVRINLIILGLICSSYPLMVTNISLANDIEQNTTIIQLIQQLKTDNSPQWYKTVDALSQRKTEAIQALRKALKDPNVRVRRGAALALAKIGVAASLAIPDLGIVIQDVDKDVRSTAIYALDSMNKPGAVFARSLKK